ncbi:MAG: CHAD domain-containing protein [Chromatiales bacterium]|jgi:CHAD domain-containing protein
MTNPLSIDYQLPEHWGLDDLLEALTTPNRFGEVEATRLNQTYLDSFDWRLWLNGGELVFEQQKQDKRLCWFDQQSGQLLETLAVDKVPEFPADLPPGSLQQRIAKPLAMRVLLPMVRIEQRISTLRLLNEDDKTVLRLALLDCRFSSPDRKLNGRLGRRVRLSPVKGYNEDFARVHKEFEALALEQVSQSLFTEALAGIGRRPGDYSSKLNYQLDPERRSDKTTKQILLSLLETIELNVAGTKANLDSEFLHDLRVATRRSRSAITQIKGVFDPQELDRFKQDLAWIGQITGPTRDLDVYLLQFEEYRQSLPAKVRPDLEPFHGFLLDHHAQAQKKLARKLNSPQFRKLIKEYRQWLEAPVSEVSKQPNAMRPIAQLADSRIRKVFKRVRKDGAAIYEDSPAEALHELRKDCKKLRYLMEFFQSLYPKPEIRELIKQLKILLDNLGEFQDLQVQAEALETFGEQMLKEGAPARTLMAMGILVGQLLTRQEQAREEFFNLFKQFSAEENVQAFKQLFGTKAS